MSETMTTTRWLTVRLVPGLALVLLAAVATGLVRGFAVFVPGILGMAAGGLSGYLWGRLSRGDPKACWSFESRLWLASGAAVLYGVGAAATVSVLRAGAMGAPLEWLHDVIVGYRGEYFAGHSTNSFQSVSGTLHGVWWLVFAAVDALLFGFLFLVLTMVGTVPDRDDDRHPVPDEVPMQTRAIAFDAGPLRVGRLGFAGFVVAALAVLASLHYGPGFVAAGSGELTSDERLWRLQGEWRFDESARFVGATPSERTFTLSRSLGDELAGMPEDPTRFIITLEPRADGVFEGTLMVRGTDILSVRMRPSPDLDILDFVVDWWGPGGRSERRLTARRLPEQP